MATYNFLDKTGLGLVWAKIKTLIKQSDWEEDDSTDLAYIQNKPAIRAGDGENSIIEGQIELPEDAAIYTIYASGTGSGTGNGNTFSYTTEDTLPSANNLKNYGVWFDATATKYSSILNVDTTNHTITISGLYGNVSFSNREIKLYYKYHFAVGETSHSEGEYNIAGSSSSHTEGRQNSAYSTSHAEGYRNKAIGQYSHAEGTQNLIYIGGMYSHAEGVQNEVRYHGNHVEGTHNIASGSYQHVQGRYNIEDVDNVYADIVGNGSSSARSNAYTLDWNGNGVYAGKVTVGAGPVNDMDVATKTYVDTHSGGAQSDWEEDDSTDPTYIQNRPAIRAGEGENSIIEGQIGEIDSSESYTIYITGAAKATTYSYTTQEESLPSGSLDGYIAYYANGSSATYQYARINSIDTTNNTIAFSRTFSASALSNVEVLILKNTQIANGTYSHAEGRGNVAGGNYSHAEGYLTVAINGYAHTEGGLTTASGTASHAEGYKTTASNTYAHSEGCNTKASGSRSHAEGYYTTASNTNTHAEGISTTASGDTSHAEGVGGTASGFSTHVEGGYGALSVTLTGAANVLTYGVETTSIFNGNSTVLIGGKVASSNTWSPNAPEITSVTVSGDILTSITLDKTLNADTAVSGSYYLLVPNKASGQGAHVEGGASLSSGNYSHAEGGRTRSSGTYSHSEGYDTIASGAASHSEGRNSIASGDYSHAGGYVGTASGKYSHAEGYHSTASGIVSHAEGVGTIAQRESQHVFGEYNIADNGGTGVTTDRGDYVEIVGNGTAEDARSNAYTLDWNGNGWYAGKVSAGTIANPASVVNANDLATKAYVDANSGGAQSDWAENDSTDPSYVQNRTHYRTSLGYTAPIDLMPLIETLSEYTFSVTIDGVDYTYNYNSYSVINLGRQYADYFPTNSLDDLDNEISTVTLIVNGVSQNLNVWYDSVYNMVNCYNNDYRFTIEKYPDLCLSYACRENLALTSFQINIPLTNEAFAYTKLDSAYLDGSLIASGNGYMSEIFNGTEGKDASGMYSHTEGDGYIDTYAFLITLTGEAGATTYMVQGLPFDPSNMSYRDYFLLDESLGKNIYEFDEKLPAKVVDFNFYSSEGYTITLTETLNSENDISGFVYSIGIPSLCALGIGSHAEGSNTVATGDGSHAEGFNTYSLRAYSHAEGSYTTAEGTSSHAEGSDTVATGDGSHAEGSNTTAKGTSSHAEGSNTTAEGSTSHAEGSNTTAEGYYSHAEGSNTIATGRASHSEGGGSDRFRLYLTGEANATTYTVQSFSGGGGAHPKILIGTKINEIEIIAVTYTGNTPQTITLASTLSTSAINNKSYYTSYIYSRATHEYSHAEGLGNYADGKTSHAEGWGTIAGAQTSHSEGLGTIASSMNQHVQGKYNIEDANNTYADIVGNGTTSARSNAYTLDWSGNGVYAGKLTVGAGPTNNMDVATKQYVDAQAGGSDVFWVHFELAPEQPPEEGINWLTADKTFAEVVTAHTAGKIVKGAYWGHLYTLAYDLDATSSMCSFECDDFSIYGNNDDGIVNSYNVHIQWQVSNNEETITVFYEHAYMPEMAYGSYTNGQILQYNSTSGKWEANSIPAQNGVLSISSNVITLTNASGTTSSITLPIYNGGVQTV